MVKQKKPARLSKDLLPIEVKDFKKALDFMIKAKPLSDQKKKAE